MDEYTGWAAPVATIAVVFSRRKRSSAPPDEDAVIGRALCLSAVTMLGAIADGVEDGTMEATAASKYLVESHRWLIRENLAAALSSDEKALLSKEIVDWTPGERRGAGRRNEAMGVLLWALSALDALPPYGTSFERLPSFVPLLAATSEFRGAARLRSPDELEHARETAAIWHWRIRSRQREEGREPHADGDHDLDAITRETAAAAFAKGSIPAPVEDDFPVHGKPLRALDADDYADVAVSAVERHYALNWLAGRAADLDHVPTDS